MNPHLCHIVLRPRGPFESFDLTLALIRARWRPLVRLTAALVAPPWLVLAGLCWLTSGHWALLPLPLLLIPALQAPTTLMSARLLFTDEHRVRDAIRSATKAIPELITISFWQLLATLIAVATCLYGAIPALGGVLYTWETGLLEGVAPSRILRRSARLALGAPADAVTGAIAPIGLTVWCAVVAEATAQTLISFVLQAGTPFGAISDGTVTPWFLLGMLLAQPLIAIYRLLLYVDARTRTEGWDLQVGLRAAALPA